MQKAKKERRISNRKQLNGLLPGKIIVAHDQSVFNCKPVDVSVNGLGVVADRELDAGSKLILEMKDGKIELQVAWTQRDFGKSDLFRYGLVAIDAPSNLETIFENSGCLK